MVDELFPRASFFQQKIQSSLGDSSADSLSRIGSGVHQKYRGNKGESEWKWKSLSCVQLFATPWTTQSRNSPAQNGVGSLFLLQGILPTQGLNPGLLHCRQILYQLSYQGSPNKAEDWESILDTQPRVLSQMVYSFPHIFTFMISSYDSAGLPSKHTRNSSLK